MQGLKRAAYRKRKREREGGEREGERVKERGRGREREGGGGLNNPLHLNFISEIYNPTGLPKSSKLSRLDQNGPR